MDDRYSLISRRRGIVNLYLFSLVFVVLFLFGEYGTWNTFLVLAAFFSLAALWSAFHGSIVSPGIWRMYRSKSDKLDEREKGVVLDCIRSSYNIFAVISPILLFGTVLSVRFDLLVLTHRGHFSLGLVLVMYLNFLIAVLPPSVIAWSEKTVGEEV